jgi:aminoglycoside 2'-N-acetyltransferase I
VRFERAVLAHADLLAQHVDGVRALFDAEYLDEYGAWDPDHPYGYAPHDFHVVGLVGDRVVGHVGFQARTITVGSTDVLVGGTGGVLVAAAARGSGLGRDLLRTARDAMRETAGVDFGYLGCRAEVVPFYESCGWTRIHAEERFRSRLDPDRDVVEQDLPLLICEALRPVDDWPSGPVDLRGTPW